MTVIKGKKYNTGGTVPNSHRKTVERDTINTPNVHGNTLQLTFLVWYRHFNKKWRGFNQFYGPNT
jgi:hypothetical protein